MSANMPIDVVITWVDGSDPKHAQKRAAHTPRGVRIADKPSTRFAHDGEVYFCIASILKYAPFVRKIWIVADDQAPKHLQDFVDAGVCPPGFIEVVDHTVIFRGYEQYLPTFNSQTIETMLWRIPGLAEHFVTLNDDFFVNAPIDPDDWFHNGKPVFSGRWELQMGEPLFLKWQNFRNKIRGKSAKARPTSKMAQGLSGKHAGLNHWFLALSHMPHPMRKSVQAAFYEKNALLEHQLSYRFRDHGQFLPSSLANHLEIHDHGVRPQKHDLEAYLSPGKPQAHFEKNLRLIETGGKKFACVQSLDQFSNEQRDQIVNVLCDKFDGYFPDVIVDAYQPK